jgi:hypothetical protein
VILLEIRNDAELSKAIGMVVKDVINEMADEILNILYDFIKKDVYDKYQPYVYKRTVFTENFLNSWVQDVKSTGSYKQTIAKIFDNPEKMVFDESRYAHGSPDSGDVREDMARIIEEGLGGHYWFPKYRRDGSINPATVKRPFFSDTIKYLEKNGRLFQMFEKGMAKRGLYVQKGKTLHWDYTVAMRLLGYGLDE